MSGWQRAYSEHARSAVYWRVKNARDRALNRAIELSASATHDAAEIVAKMPGDLTPGQSKAIARVLKRLSRLNGELTKLLQAELEP